MNKKAVNFKKLMGSLSQLKENDYVVHQDYGIGIYRGLKHIQIEDEDSEEVLFDSKSDDKSSEPPVAEESLDERVEVPPIDDEDDGEIDLGEDDEVEENGNDDSGEIDLTENDKPIDPEEMDHEDAEKYYFGNKPAPRESMKSSNSNKSYDNFVVKKRKRNS